MHPIFPRLLLALCGGVAVTAHAAGAPPPGRLLAAQCAQCHGTNGQSLSDIEGLAGEGATDLYRELLEMKNGSDTDIMSAQAHGYSEQELQLVAQYFASLPGSGEHGGDDHDD